MNGIQLTFYYAQVFFVLNQFIWSIRRNKIAQRWTRSAWGKCNLYSFAQFNRIYSKVGQKNSV